jgi:hypothetical protein
MLNSFSKADQLSRSPGNRKKQSAPEKGAALEKEIVKAFGGKAKRNHQGKPGGGLNNADVTAMPDWHVESKNCAAFNMHGWHKQLEEDCPKNKKKALVYAHKGKPWISIELENINAFCFDRIEQLGMEVS